MIWLLLGLVLWSAAHLFKRVLPDQRAALGNKGRGLVALLVLISLGLMIMGYRAAETTFLYALPAWVWHANNALMLIALFLMDIGRVKAPAGQRGRGLAGAVRRAGVVGASGNGGHQPGRGGVDAAGTWQLRQGCHDVRGRVGALRRHRRYPPLAGLPGGRSSDLTRAYSASSRITLIRSDLPSKPMPGRSGMTMWPSSTFTESGNPP